MNQWTFEWASPERSMDTILDLLAEGYEPFAVTQSPTTGESTVWLKKLTDDPVIPA